MVTVSNSRTEATDLGGPAVCDALRGLGFKEIETRLVRDDVESIKRALIELSATCLVVFTTGGTGLSPLDLTPEATTSLIERPAPGLAELLRAEGAKQTPMSALSRGTAGLIGSTLVVNLPGSPRGASHGVGVLAPLLPHIIEQLRGEGDHPC